MRRELVWSGVVGLASVVAGAIYGCGENSSGDCSDNGTCPVTDANAPMPDTGSAVPDTGAMVDAGVDATVEADASTDATVMDSAVAPDGGGGDGYRDPGVGPARARGKEETMERGPKGRGARRAASPASRAPLR